MIFFYFSKFFNFQLLNIISSSVAVVRFLLLTTLISSFFTHSVTFWLFIKHLINSNNILLFDYNVISLPTFFVTKFFFFELFGIQFCVEFFGFIFILLAYIVGIISFLCLESQFYWKNARFLFICNFLVLIIYLFSICNDFIMFFILYESLLIPSFLFVYYTSQYKRGIQASLYFLIWTQLGSFLVLCATAYIISTVGGSSFNLFRCATFTSNEIVFIYTLIFLGFGFKIPIWPFHYWLTKTHVEAPAGFSIFLSGFLVKSAVYGFYRISNLMSGDIDTTLYSVLPVLGVIDSSLKMWAQIDLKKLVAYCTIQEMSLLYLVFVWGDVSCFIGGIMLCITHSLLSSLMFFLVDCIQKRYKSRLVSEISGILHTTPNLGLSLLFMNILYAGIPGSIKFTSELYIYSGLFETAPFSSIMLLFIANFLGLIGFSKCWFNVVFGAGLKPQNVAIIDLTFKELFIIFICIFCSFLFNFFFNLFI